MTTDTLLGCEGGNVVGSDGFRVALKASHYVAVHVLYHYVHRALYGLVGIVLHLALYMDCSSTGGNIVLRSIDVDTRRTQSGHQRQCLIDVVGNMEPHILWQSAVIYVECLRVPLEVGSCGLFLVFPVVVGTYLDEVVTIIYNIRCEVETEGHRAVLMDAQSLSVQEYLGGLAGTLKLNEHFLAFGFGWQTECLAIPHHRGRRLVGRYLEGFALVPGMGQGDGLFTLHFYLFTFN